MNENANAAAISYNDMMARPGFYKDDWGFDPLRYLRESADEEGRTELSLDVKFRRHWFRLVHPEGKITVRPVDVNERFAIFCARIYADKKDAEESFLAEGTAIRYNGGENAKAYERYYVDWAETIAIGRALSNAGFDVPWCNIPTGFSIDRDTGEVKDDGQNPTRQPRQYSSVTAPPEQMSAPQQTPTAAQTPALQQAHNTAQTPALQQAPAQIPQGTPPVQPTNLQEALRTMSVEQAKALTVDFGQNKGKTLAQIAIDSPKDLEWLANKYQGRNFMLQAGAQIMISAAHKLAS